MSFLRIWWALKEKKRSDYAHKRITGQVKKLGQARVLFQDERLGPAG